MNGDQEVGYSLQPAWMPAFVVSCVADNIRFSIAQETNSTAEDQAEERGVY
jgi:hypothetical protein